MPFLIVLAVLLGLAAIVLGIARWSFGKAFAMPNKKKKVDPHLFFGNERDMQYKEPMMRWVDDALSRPFERVEITSHDGLRLVGRFYPAPNSDGRLEIFFHGWRGAALRETICKKLHLASLEFQTLDGICEAIGIGPENLCTYCWSGKE